MSKSDALRDVSTIDGWLSDAEAEALYDFARVAQGPIVEIGSCYGRSTAALARGSMDGNRHPVYAVDSFVGVQPANQVVSSPELLRSNLDRVGVNGLVEILAKPSQEAVGEVPSSIDLLFIDGAHDCESVRRDIGLYAPKVRVGGKVVCHDATPRDQGVLDALDATLTADARRWQPVCRVDSAVVYERRQETERFKVFLAMPGPNLKYCAAAGLMTASCGVHDVTPRNSGNGWDDMNVLWVEALNAAQRGEITHFAMLHSDIHPSIGWVDTLASEMVRHGADLISTVVALKDPRGLSSTGVGNPDDPWNAFRRFTMRELHEMPETFSIADTPHPERYLLHNTGCWLADLRNPAWRTVDDSGFLLATFSFPVAAQIMPDGTVEHRRESEDWYFSRKIAGLPLKTFATRKVVTSHFGDTPYVNNRPWGDYLFGDEATRANWGAEQCPT